MKCTKCAAKMYVTHTLPQTVNGSQVLYRERACRDCGEEVSTAEVLVEKITQLFMAGIPVGRGAR